MLTWNIIVLEDTIIEPSAQELGNLKVLHLS